MKTITILFALFITVNLSAQGQLVDYEAFNFRGTHWGASAEMVIKAMGKEPKKQNETAILYKEKVSDIDATLVYIFKADSLFLIIYEFINKHSEHNLYLRDFGRIHKLLVDKYGEPTDATYLWKNELYKGDKKNYGLAITLGHLVLTSKWKLPDTTIQLSMYDENHQVKHYLRYEKYAESKTKEKKTKDKL